MKNFLRSIPGKTIIFILLVISCTTAAVSFLGELVFWDTTMPYTTEATFQEEMLYDMVISTEDDFIFRVSGPTLEPRDTEYINRYYGEGRTNLLIQYDLVTPQGVERIYSNTPFIEKEIYQSYFTATWDENGFADYKRLDSLPEHPSNDTESEPQEEPYEYYSLKMGLKPDLPIDDIFKLASRLTHYVYVFHNVAIPVAIATGLLAIVLFVVLMCVSARRPNTEELIPGLLNWVPFDLMTCIIGTICVMLILAIIEVFENITSHTGFVPLLQLGCAALIVLLCLILGWCMSLAARIKQRNVLKNTVCWKLCSLLFRVIRTPIRWLCNFVLAIPFMWKAIILWIAYFLFASIIILDAPRHVVFFINLCTALFILYCIYAMFKVNRKAKSISNGYYEQSTDKSLILGFRDLDQNLTKINSGLSVAVEQRMKSERMKTELITNVSHDIKTPLTSIINYADLIGKEETDNPTIKEYSEVLHRQSVKLKRLIEDLIEASKASTGNIDLHMEQCDLNVIIPQITGEYIDKLNEANLTLITKTPQEPVLIMADGRRLWRVFDNLMGNIIKYSLPGTRVYISMVRQNGEAILVFKNTSRDQIDLSPEELTERFVRGDESRNTEGNGLGLSIAKSLVELQGGILSLYADGDLFKVILRFPLI